MKKRLLIFCVVVVVISVCVSFSACRFDSATSLEKDSEIKAVELIYKDGYTIQLDKEGADYIANTIKAIPEFSQDSKILVNNRWEYEYDYTFRITFMRKQFFKKVETTIAYRFGTTGIYTDNSGKQNKRYFENEWTYTVAGARKIADTDKEKSKEVRAYLDNLASTQREDKFSQIKKTFLDEGYTLRDLEGAELNIVSRPDSDEFISLYASKGFEANNEKGTYYVYFADREKAEDFKAQFSAFGGYSNDVFCGYGSQDGKALISKLF